MGFWGKSREEIENERRAQQAAKEEREREAKREDEYKQLVKVIERLKELKPIWKLGDKYRFNRMATFNDIYRYKGCELKVYGETPDGITITIERWGACVMPLHDRGTTNKDGYGSIEIRQAKTDKTDGFKIFSLFFHQGNKDCECIDNYLRPIIEPFIQANNQQKAAEQSIKNKFLGD